jgi:hypothetical protein
MAPTVRRSSSLSCQIGVSGEPTGIGVLGSSSTDMSSTLTDTGNHVSSAGAYQAANPIGRAQNVLKNLTAHAKQSAASVSSDQTISLEVRNPNGVSNTSSQKSAGVDDDMK